MGVITNIPGATMAAIAPTVLGPVTGPVGRAAAGASGVVSDISAGVAGRAAAVGEAAQRCIANALTYARGATRTTGVGKGTRAVARAARPAIASEA